MDTISHPSQLPKVDKLLRHPHLLELQKQIRREVLIDIVRLTIEKYRLQLIDDGKSAGQDEIARDILRKCQDLLSPRLRRVINGTGIILNTNLGRAPLAPECLEQIKVSSGYCNLEIDLASGKRGERTGRIEELLQLLTGCEAALVVNNNAAAVSLAVNTLSRNRETIVSRGELIEIGGSFRLPDVIKAAGGKLREVGTTNRTRPEDYQQAVSMRTGLILRCHRSNFEISGFTEEAALQDLVEISKQNKIPLLQDLGSGILIHSHELRQEPTVSQVISTGCDLVTFSGDKLLGGPQAGIIVGKKELVGRLHKNPFYRIFRADKLVLAALEATLTICLSPDAESRLPCLFMISKSPEDIRKSAATFSLRVNQQLRNIACQVAESESAAGAGSLPGHSLKSFSVILQSSIQANRLARMLRNNDPPIIPIISANRVMIDFRTLTDPEEDLLFNALQNIDCTAGGG